MDSRVRANEPAFFVQQNPCANGLLEMFRQLGIFVKPERVL